MLNGQFNEFATGGGGNITLTAGQTATYDPNDKTLAWMGGVLDFSGDATITTIQEGGYTDDTTAFALSTVGGMYFGRIISVTCVSGTIKVYPSNGTIPTITP